MSIRRKILFNSLIGLVLSILMIGFIITKMLSIQNSNEDNVSGVVAVKDLSAEMRLVSLNLNNYASHPTEGNKKDSLDELRNVDKAFVHTKPLLVTKQGEKYFELAYSKFKTLTEETETAFNSDNLAEIKKQSMKTKGISNDLYSLNLITDSHYNFIKKSTKDQIDFVITFALIGSIALMIISAFFLIRMTNSIIKPLKKLTKNAQEIASGNLVVEKVNYKNNDELGTLNESFSKMVEQLTSLITSIGSASQKVESFAIELEQENEHLTESSKQIAFSTDELSIGTQSISENLQSSVELVGQMDRGFAANVNIAHQSFDYASDASVAITEGRNAINMQQVLLTENIQATHSIEEATKEFIQYATKIEDMANIVSKIANQTNLLSLNATIEAARAGEAGRGFAVVAQEVRKLADESTTATVHIFEMVKLIQQGLGIISDSVEKGVKISNEQSQHMARTLGTFEQIEEKVQGISTVLEELVVGVDNSKKSNENVLKNVENISAVVEETAAGSEEISASTTEQLTSFSNVVDKITSLRTLTNELNTTLSQFSFE
ncbi:methyl-accepting chemotaxis protein [Fictibacillus enclensis]|uniref:methyl-accepting chemotaxis protein n=1 Tax=Fictibacillus enclensis TaxID=1017270 RepID=UPI0024C01A50|nr:methyl-accepting chemotaxis protein [Fictibacillus enclensis]WHY72054.1 methyl-accepting chemotaxis protein [Fictibacillus enclensis]